MSKRKPWDGEPVNDAYVDRMIENFSQFDKDKLKRLAGSESRQAQRKVVYDLIDQGITIDQTEEEYNCE